MHAHALPSAPALPGPAFTASWLAAFAERVSASLARWAAGRRDRLAASVHGAVPIVAFGA